MIALVLLVVVLIPLAYAAGRYVALKSVESHVIESSRHRAFLRSLLTESSQRSALGEPYADQVAAEVMVHLNKNDNRKKE